MKIFTNKKGLPCEASAKQGLVPRSLGEVGFTLIELLVVISIIGLLSSIVLASTQGFKEKAEDSKTISQLVEMKKLAEISNTDGNYGTANGSDCGTLGIVFTNNKFDDVDSWPTIDVGQLTPICHANTTNNGDLITSFSVWNQLNNGKGWCVDSEGNSLSMDTAPNTDNCVSGSLLDLGQSCSVNSECSSGFCGYDYVSPYPRICTDGSNSSLCTSIDLCASNICDPNSSLCVDTLVNNCQFQIFETGGNAFYQLYVGSETYPRSYDSSMGPITVPCNQSLAVVISSFYTSSIFNNWDCPPGGYIDPSSIGSTCYYNPEIGSDRTLNITYQGSF